MDSFKSVFFKPDPREQKRKCDAIIRQGTRELDKGMRQTKVGMDKNRQQIKAAAKLAQNNPAQRKVALQNVRTLAKSQAQATKSYNRLNTQKAQLESVSMQVNEVFAMRKIEASMKSSTGVMKEVNKAIRMPALTETMAQLSQELMKAGVIEEMMDDMMPNDELLEDGETEPEINEIIRNALGKESETFFREEQDLPEVPDQIEQTEEPNLDEMRQKLEALKS